MENRTADGPLLKELVEQCAPDVPDWEVSDCWPLRDYPGLSELGLEPHDDGIDLIAEKTDGRRVAIQCKALSDGNVTTTMIQKFAGKANRFRSRTTATLPSRSGHPENGNARDRVLPVAVPLEIADAEDAVANDDGALAVAWRAAHTGPGALWEVRSRN